MSQVSFAYGVFRARLRFSPARKQEFAFLADEELFESNER